MNELDDLDRQILGLGELRAPPPAASGDLARQVHAQPSDQAVADQSPSLEVSGHPECPVPPTLEAEGVAEIAPKVVEVEQGVQPHVTSASGVLSKTPPSRWTSLSLSISHAMRNLRSANEPHEERPQEPVVQAVVHHTGTLDTHRPAGSRLGPAFVGVALFAGLALGSVVLMRANPSLLSWIVAAAPAQIETAPEAASGVLGSPTAVPAAAPIASDASTEAVADAASDAAFDPAASADAAASAVESGIDRLPSTGAKAAVRASPVPAAVLNKALPSISDLPPPKPETSDAASPPTAQTLPLHKVGSKAPAVGGQPSMAAAAQPAKHPIAAEVEEDAEPVAIQPKSKEPVSAALIPKPSVGMAKTEAPKAPAPVVVDPLPKTSSAAKETRKFGWQGIALVTGKGVVVTGKDGQREVPVGAKLPDGSTLKAVDPKVGRITTDRGQITFTE